MSVFVCNVYECDDCGHHYYASGKSARCPSCKSKDVAVVSEVDDV